MIKNFLNGFKKSPEIAYPTLLFAALLFLSSVIMVVADCNDAVRTVGSCKCVVVYFGVLTLLSPWVEKD